MYFVNSNYSENRCRQKQVNFHQNDDIYNENSGILTRLKQKLKLNGQLRTPLYVQLNYIMYFYRTTACNTTHSIAVEILSVHPSIHHCDKTK